MKLTVEISNENEIEKVLNFFNNSNLKSLNLISENLNNKSIIQKGNKILNPKDLFGIWEKKPQNIIDLRASAWGKNK